MTVLGAGDVALMRGLNAMFAEAFEDRETYCSAPPSDGYLADLLAKPHTIAIAALAAGDVVGGLFAYQLDKFEQARSEIYIYDLAVAETHRRRGVATAVIEALQGVAAERGADVIYVQADRGDAPAIALYNKLGAIETVHHFDIPVPQRGGRGGAE
ncbi:MAG: AAC(3)-I family aminoglycoside N-acetyltransferase [Pseudomonadota bacterium]